MKLGTTHRSSALARFAGPAAFATLVWTTGAAGMSFSDVSQQSGFEPGFLADIPSGGIAVADYDGNGYPDLFVTGYLQDNRLYFNQGDGTFSQDPAINADIAGNRCSVAAAADYDNDGWPDIYVGCRNQSNLLLRNLAGNGFENAIVPAIDHNTSSANSARTDAVAWGDLTGNGHLDLFVGIYPTSGAPDLDDPDNLDRILLNHGDGSWSNVTLDYSGADRAKLARTALAVAISDFDGDGRPDIYVVNDKLHGNVLWRNEGPGCGDWCFSDVAADAGADTEVYGMGLAVGDVDRDGLWDFFFSSIDEQVLLRGTGQQPLAFQRETSTVLDHDAVGWGTIFADFDNDGWEDAYLAVNSGSFASSSNIDQLFRNQQDGSFVAVTDGTVFDVERPSEPVAIADFDLDGRLDLVVGHWNQSPGYRLYRNTTTPAGNWIGFRLEGGGPVNRDAIGTKVVVDAGDGPPQVRELRAGESRGSSHQQMLHFGLGAQGSADVTVVWPDGLTQSIQGMPAGQYHELSYPDDNILFTDRFSASP
jgi:hypothetical protein